MAGDFVWSARHLYAPSSRLILESTLVPLGNRDMGRVAASLLARGRSARALRDTQEDHPRNHALLARNVDWALSPAYDLTPSPVVSLDRRDLALVCGDGGRFADAKAKRD